MDASRFHLRVFDRLPSTNDYAQHLLAASPPDRTVIWARDQFAGRGQRGNHWLSEPGSNLTLSVIVYPRLPTSRLFALSQASALAMWATARHFAPQAEVLLKWPNDLLIDGRKAGGILIETQLQGSQVSSAVLGLGLNVNQEVFPPDLAPRSYSLRQVGGGRPLPIEAVRDVLLDALDQQLLAIASGAFDQLDRAYRGQLYGYQEEIPVEIDGQISRRLLVGLDGVGRLALAHQDRLTYFDVKEVRVLLPVEDKR